MNRIKIFTQFFNKKESILEKQGRSWLNKDILNKKNEIKIMTLNLLSEEYMFKELYSDCNPLHLDWDFRKKKLIQEIKEINSDIILFQEVEIDKKNDIEKIMNNLNCEFYYKQKEDRTNIRLRKDGLAISINKDKFKMIENYFINFNFESIFGKSEFKNINNSLKNLNYNNISLFSVIYCKNSKKNILIVNCHLIFNRQKPQIKFLQLCIIYDIIEKIKKIQKIDYIIMGGDFNIIPNSMIYDMITKNIININVDPNEFSNQFLMLSHINTESELKHQIIDANMKFNHNNINLTETKFKKKLIQSIKLLKEIDYKINKLENINEILPEFKKDLNEINKKITKYDINEVNYFKEIGKSLNFKSIYSEIYNNLSFKDLLKTDFKYIINENNKNDFNLENILSHFTIDFKATCDYLFVTNNIETQNVLNPPNYNLLKKLKITPNENIISDHFSLAGIIKLN